MSIAYTKYFAELDAITDEIRRLLAASNRADDTQLTARIDEARQRTTAPSPLRIVLMGEWNAGKSSLIAALTGAEVAIDADVCTEVAAEFDWQGLTLVDTPGIQAQRQDTDHDRISRQATIGADLVLFVITNELFNPRLAAHLRFVLDDEGLGSARKTVVVVNKFDRESNPEAVLLGEIQAVLGPHQYVPVFFASSLKFLRAGSAPPELRQRFLLQSRLATLTEGIDRFVDDAGLLGRLAAPLQVLADVADSLQAGLMDADEDKSQLELIRRQKTVLQGLQRNLRDVSKTWKQQAYSMIIGHTEAAVQQVDDTFTGEDLERLFEMTMALAVSDVERLHDGVEDAISGALDEARLRLDEIGQSQLGKEVAHRGRARAERIAVGFDQTRPGEKAYLGRMGRIAIDPLKQGLEAASNNAKGLGQFVYQVGKAIGKKFRPWGAVNSGKTLASAATKLSKAVPAVAAMLDIYVQYREDKVKDEQARYFANMRLALRYAFAEQARLEAEVLEATINELSQGPLVEALAALDSQAAHLAASNESAAALARDIVALKQRCSHLRNLVVGGLSTELSVQ